MIHYCDCPTPNVRLDQCRHCVPSTRLRPNYPSPQQTWRTPYHVQEQGQRSPTYAQVLRTPPAAPRPRHRQLDPEQPAQNRSDSCRTPDSPTSAGVRNIRQAQYRAPQGQQSYAQAAQLNPFRQPPSTTQTQASNNRASQGQLSQPLNPVPPSQPNFVQVLQQTLYGQPAISGWGQEINHQCHSGQPSQPPTASWPYETPPTGISHQRARRTVLDQQQHPQILQQPQTYPFTPVPTDYRGTQAHRDPSSMEVWIQQPRVAADRTTPAADIGHLLSPSMSVASPASSSQQSSGQRSRRRARMEMSDQNEDHQHQCQVCQRWYATKNDCKKHELRRHGEMAARPHACPEDGCPWRFNHPRELQRHWDAVHNSGGPTLHFCRYYGCTLQSHGFTRRDNRDRHERSHHGEGSP